MSVQGELFEREGSSKRTKTELKVEQPLDESFSVEKFVANFDVLAEAEESVSTLRRFVLTLAMTGRLTTQLPDDGDARSLLTTLRAGSERAAKKTSMPAEDVSDGPTQLPASWCWARFLDVASIDSCLVDPGKFMDAPHVAPDNIEKGTGRLLEYRTVREDRVTSNKHRFFPGQIVYSKIRPNLSKVVVVDFEGVCSADMYPITSKIDRAYLHRFMLSAAFLEQVVKDDNRLAMPKVNQEQLGATLVALPPLAEQKRIVAKVDQLMALCDELEARQARRRETRTRLTKSALEALTTADGPEEFSVAWKRVVENFDVLIDRAETVKELREAVLGLAASGRLTPTNASRLHKTPDGDSYAPEFAIPATWAWSPLGLLCRFIDYRGRTPTKTSNGVRLITAKNVRMGFLRDEPREFIANADYDRWMTRGLPQRGDVLFTTEAPLGNVAQLLSDDRVALAQRIITLRPIEAVDAAFLKTVLMSPQMQAAIRRHATGTTATGIKAAKLKLIPFPVAPLGDQQAIVAKVEHLLRTCDDLEARLQRAEERAAKLVEAVVQDLVG